MVKCILFHAKTNNNNTGRAKLVTFKVRLMHKTKPKTTFYKNAKVYFVVHHYE